MTNKLPYQRQKEKGRIFRRLGRAYKGTTLLEKSAGFGGLAILFASLILNAGENPLLAVLGLLTIFLIFNLIVYKANLLFATFILALHIALLPYVGSLYSYLNPSGFNGDVVSPIIVMIASTVFFTLLSYRICRGRYWFTLLLVLFSLSFGGILVSLAFEQTWGTAPGIILAALAVLIRCIKWTKFKKTENFIPPDLVDSSQDDKTLSLLELQGYTVVSIREQWPLSHIAYSKQRVFLISTFTPKTDLIINKNRFYYNGSFIEPLLYEIVKKAEAWSKNNKVEAKNITTIALFHDTSKFPTGDVKLSVQIAEKGSKHNSGQMYLVTPAGFDDLNELPVPHFSYKTYQKIDKELKNPVTPVTKTKNVKTKKV